MCLGLNIAYQVIVTPRQTRPTGIKMSDNHFHRFVILTLLTLKQPSSLQTQFTTCTSSSDQNVVVMGNGKSFILHLMTPMSANDLVRCLLKVGMLVCGDLIYVN